VLGVPRSRGASALWPLPVALGKAKTPHGLWGWGAGGFFFFGGGFRAGGGVIFFVGREKSAGLKFPDFVCPTPRHFPLFPARVKTVPLFFYTMVGNFP